MNPYAAIGAVLAFMSLLGTIGFLANSWKVQIETNYAYKLDARLAEQAKIYQEQTAKKTTEFADSQHDKEINALATKHETEQRFRELNFTLERMAHEQPFKASNLYEYNVRRLMCFISEGGDTAGRETCNRFEAATEDYAPELAAFVTITRETTDYWNEQCDAGVKSFCDYSLMALTERGSMDLLTDLKEIDYYQLKLNYSEDAKIEALKYLRDIQLPEEKAN